MPDLTVPTASASPPAPSAPPVKPGARTSEFWLHLAAVFLSALFASGLLTNNTAVQIAGIAGAMLGSFGYTVARSGVKQAASDAAAAIAKVGLVLCVLLAVTACGASARDTAIRDTFTVTNSATLTLEAANRKQEAAIIAGAASLDDGKAKLAAYRAKVATVEAALDAVYRAISAAAAVNTDQSLASMAAAALTLKQALADLGVSL